MTSLAKSVGPLDGRGNLPLYQELQRALRKAIDSRILGPDDALPSERDLAADFAVSRITVTQGAGRTGGRRTAGAPSGFGKFRVGPRR